MSREQYFQKQVAQKSKIPPVGLHRKRYDAMDRKVSVPVYGESNIWNKHLAKNSKIIKEKDFKEKVKKCPPCCPPWSPLIIFNTKHFKLSSNWIDLFSLYINVIVLWMRYMDVDLFKIRIITSIAIVLIWM